MTASAVVLKLLGKHLLQAEWTDERPSSRVIFSGSPGDTPTNSASRPQCIRCGRHFPTLISFAYTQETPSAVEIAEVAMFANAGFIRVSYACSVSQAGWRAGSQFVFAAAIRRCVAEMRA
jgi:hypothetical protein